ncbi:DUF5715 family protein [Dysgonomonas sp. 511]|uniref:DUF5715 family protein n=1 Tax=Dysgonomonas sp. 511 TaxID=2302930 RepID=UPI001C878C61|nr:DUF5715 family protein [Dysgonomonas sp. 511]
MKWLYICFACIFVALNGCNSGDNSENGKDGAPKKYTRFNGNYNKTFNDLPDLHKAAAQENGIELLETRDDTLSRKDKLVRIAGESDVYKLDKLTHSIPYLVPKAVTLLSDIGLNFRDSLISKKMPLYKPIVTSVTRTGDDMARLRKKNINASENSVHCYATTFDIAWTRFSKVDNTDERSLDDGKLKAVLGQVLHDLRERDRCYIKHERKQSCFHITVR